MRDRRNDGVNCECGNEGVNSKSSEEKAACVFKVSVATAGSRRCRSLTPDAPQLEGSRLKISLL